MKRFFVPICFFVFQAAHAAWPTRSVDGKTIRQVCAIKNLCDRFSQKELNDDSQFKIQVKNENALLITYKKLTVGLEYLPQKYLYTINNRPVDFSNKNAVDDILEKIRTAFPKNVSYSLMYNFAYAEVEHKPDKNMAAAVFTLMTERNEDKVCIQAGVLLNSCLKFLEKSIESLKAKEFTEAEVKRNKLRDLYGFHSEARNYKMLLDMGLTNQAATLKKCQCDKTETACFYSPQLEGGSRVEENRLKCAKNLALFSDEVKARYGTGDDIYKMIQDLNDSVFLQQSVRTTTSKTLQSPSSKEQNNSR